MLAVGSVWNIMLEKEVGMVLFVCDVGGGVGVVVVSVDVIL